MNQITESVLSEKIAQLGAELQALRSMVTILVFEVGKGKNVSIPKSRVKRAEKAIGSIDYRQMSTGEIRFTVTEPKEGTNE